MSYLASLDKVKGRPPRPRPRAFLTGRAAHRLSHVTHDLHMDMRIHTHG